MRLRILLPLLLIIMYTHFLHAQRSLGFYGDRYSGYEQLHSNPALANQSPYAWDVTLGGVHGFGYSDYAFIRKTSLLGLRSAADELQVIEAQSQIPDANSDVPLLIFDENRANKIAALHGRILGPAIRFSLADFSIGIGTSYRGHASSFNIPENLGTYELNESISTQVINISEAQFSYAAWSEISLNIARSMGNSSFGLSIKLMQTSGAAGYINNNSASNFSFVDDVISIPESGVDLDYALDFQNIDEPEIGLFAGEMSLGIDIGYLYTGPSFSIGASILDIGTLHNSDIGVSVLSRTDGGLSLDLTDYRIIDEPGPLEDQILSDLPIISSNEHLHIGLPTALHIHGDWSYDDRLKVSGSFFMRTPIHENSLKADNLLQVTPRYESKWISVFLPVTLYEYTQPRLGLAARFGFLTLGSEQLSSVLLNQDFRGSDFYLKLSLFPFWQTHNSNGSKRSKSKLGCYEF